jgi:hypothetical protein
MFDLVPYLEKVTAEIMFKVEKEARGVEFCFQQSCLTRSQSQSQSAEETDASRF